MLTEVFVFSIVPFFFMFCCTGPRRWQLLVLGHKSSTRPCQERDPYTPGPAGQCYSVHQRLAAGTITE